MRLMETQMGWMEKRKRNDNCRYMFFFTYPKHVLPFKPWMIKLCDVVDHTTKGYESRIK
jgi:hypothetical protein